MTDDAKATTWKTYQAAWAEHLSSAERQDLLTRSVTDDCVYTDPHTQCNGSPALLAYIEQFRQQMPVGAFENHTFRTHHHQSLASWVLYSGQGAEPQLGNSYAHFGRDGRLTRVAGFFETAPTAT